jgi:hypothetical protein
MKRRELVIGVVVGAYLEELRKARLAADGGDRHGASRALGRAAQIRNKARAVGGVSLVKALDDADDEELLDDGDDEALDDLDPDQIDLDDLDDEDLDKGLVWAALRKARAATKYLAKIPTGKVTKTGKPRFRYVYKVGAGRVVRGQPDLDPVAPGLLTHEERRRYLRGELGTFYVRGADGVVREISPSVSDPRGFTRSAKIYKIAGEPGSFSSWDVISWIEEQHQAAYDEARERRFALYGKLAQEILDTVDKRRAAFEARALASADPISALDPELVALGKLQERAVALLHNAIRGSSPPDPITDDKALWQAVAIVAPEFPLGFIDDTIDFKVALARSMAGASPAARMAMWRLADAYLTSGAPAAVPDAVPGLARSHKGVVPANARGGDDAKAPETELAAARRKTRWHLFHLREAELQAAVSGTAARVTHLCDLLDRPSAAMPLINPDLPVSDGAVVRVRGTGDAGVVRYAVSGAVAQKLERRWQPGPATAHYLKIREATARAVERVQTDLEAAGVLFSGTPPSPARRKLGSWRNLQDWAGAAVDAPPTDPDVADPLFSEILDSAWAAAVTVGGAIGGITHLNLFKSLVVARSSNYRRTSDGALPKWSGTLAEVADALRKEGVARAAADVVKDFENALPMETFALSRHLPVVNAGTLRALVEAASPPALRPPQPAGPSDVTLLYRNLRLRLEVGIPESPDPMWLASVARDTEQQAVRFAEAVEAASMDPAEASALTRYAASVRWLATGLQDFADDWRLSVEAAERPATLVADSYEAVLGALLPPTHKGRTLTGIQQGASSPVTSLDGRAVRSFVLGDEAAYPLSGLLAKVSDRLAMKPLNIYVARKYVRAYWSTYGRAVVLAPNTGSPSTTAVHEVCHAIECDNLSISQAAMAFVASRSGGKPPRKLSELTQSRSYKADEVAYKGRAISPYVLKEYETSLTRSGSTEVLSMGAEALVRNPRKFYQEDPEHFFLTVAALAGRLDPVGQ